VEYVPQKAEGDDVFEKFLGWGFGGPGWCINRQFQVYDDGSFGFHGASGSNAEPERSVSRGSESGVSELSATETDGRDLALSLVGPLLVTSRLSLVFLSQV
jgi:hypothetical protein